MIWSLLNLAVLFIPNPALALPVPRSALSWFIATLPYLISLVWPFWYLRLPEVKATFH
jgi:hypothetical protein